MECFPKLIAYKHRDVSGNNLFYRMNYCQIFLAGILWLLFSCSRDVTNDIIDPDLEFPDVPEKIYVIDNAAFGIRSDKTAAEATTNGINNAIEYAKKEGYNVVKLPKGDYLIHCIGTTDWYPENGIFVPTNMTLDLTDARLHVAPNTSKHYALIQIDHVENAKVIGGRLIGDRAQQSNSYFAGYGIQVIASRNVTIQDVTIEGMTGSGMIFTMYNYMHFFGRFPSKNVKITGCDISDCGRHGIHAIETSGLEISDNHFHDLVGYAHQYAIDINPSSAKCVMENVKIHNNTFENCTGGMRLYGGHDIEVIENVFKNLGIFGLYCQRVRLYKNDLGTGSIYISKSTETSISEDYCIPQEGELKNICSKVTDYSTKTADFKCP